MSVGKWDRGRYLGFVLVSGPGGSVGVCGVYVCWWVNDVCLLVSATERDPFRRNGNPIKNLEIDMDFKKTLYLRIRLYLTYQHP